MRVILLKDVENLGQAGEVKNVADGFARNYLLPRGLVKISTPKALKEIEAQKEKRNQEETAWEEKFRSWQEKINNLTFEVSLKPRGETGVFGSVSEKGIQEFLREQGIDIEKSKIHLPEPIKTTGDHVIKIRLGKNLETTLKVTVRPSDVLGAPPQ